ncbi:MAG: 5'-methylthioadenosine/S-adenosylhomocysteine nucleosidase [Pyrinomonadaceae bacterium]
MSKTLIVMPLEKEFTALTEFLTSAGHGTEELAGKTTASWFRDLTLVVAVAGHGKAQFAATTQYLIDHYGPFGLVVAAGAAGGLAGHLRPGDVVMATETVEHDYKLRFRGDAPAPRHPCTSEVRARIAHFYPQSSVFRLHVGPIASGDEDVVDAARAQELHKQTDALCVAWEGAGGAKAAQLNGIPFLEIRAVTDAADGEAPESYRIHHLEAVKNIGRVLLPWLRDQMRQGDAQQSAALDDDSATLPPRQ